MAVLVIGSIWSPARAEPAAPGEAAVQLRVQSCGNVSTAKIQRILLLELSAVQHAPTKLDVDIICASDRVHIRASADDTQERTVPPLNHDMPDRERILALAVSQLFVHIYKKQEPQKQPTPEPPRIEAPKPGVAPPKEVPRARWEPFASGAILRPANDLQGPLLQAGGGVAWTGLHRILVRTTALYETGEVTREQGRVSVSSALLQAAVSWEWARWQRLGLGLGGFLGVNQAWLRGAPNDDGLRGGNAHGTGARFGGTLGGVLAPGDLRLRLDAVGAVLFAGAEGAVVRERTVTMHGAWFGANLTFGWALR